ncbi:MAG: bifunctional phosphopantothenoylcysteine decarboxylase/phosphopantothenate--cysteine ligase CoaBC [Candidatus Bathyarchaeia archaeon]
MAFHTSKDIIGTKSAVLKGRVIVLCMSGSVAAVRSPDIARELMRRGAEVHVVMSQNARYIVHPYMMEWATGNPVVTELTGKVEHVTLAGEHRRRADLILVAPSTANTLSKIACGIDDTTVTTVVSTAFGSGIPIVIVPAMHESLYKHPIVAENIEKLKALGVGFVGPRFEEGKAKIADVSEVVEAAINRLSAKEGLAGMKVVVTAGPTIEHIDPVRVITNRSSGKMGVAVVDEALSRGAEVTLIYGPGTAVPPRAARVVRVESTKEMHEAVVSELKSGGCDIFVATAAVADWTPEKPFERKVSTHTMPVIDVRLKPTPKIINVVKEISPETFLVAFRAEYGLSDEELVESAYRSLKTAGADLIVANDVGREGVGFGVDTNEVFIVDGERTVIHVPITSKREIARRLLDVVIEKLG